MNFAAESHNSYAVVNPGVFFRTNAMGTQTLLEAARRKSLDRFHHISTCEVYGDLDLDTDEKFTEESPLTGREPRTTPRRLPPTSPSGRTTRPTGFR